MKPIRLNALFDAAEIPSGSRTRAKKALLEGQMPPGTKNREEMETVLAGLGMEWTDVDLGKGQMFVPAPAPEEGRYTEAAPVSLKEALSQPKEPAPVKGFKAPEDKQPPLLEHHLLEDLCKAVVSRLAPGVTVQLTGQ